MYKIYINDVPVVLKHANELDSTDVNRPDKIIAPYTGKPKFFLNYADMLEKGRKMESIVLYSEQYEQMVADFDSNYQLIEAAGGCVFNDGKLLVIYRRDSWDMPKGKIDPGESPEQAALREVEEETGLTQLKLGSLLAITYHTYRDRKEKRILKKTYWYQMETPQTELHPQHEEDIEKAEWVDSKSFLAEKPVVYRSIEEVILKTF
jgi:8-oxo-dGTP pyrophosphatase MutT (NUDIX family)